MYGYTRVHAQPSTGVPLASYICPVVQLMERRTISILRARPVSTSTSGVEGELVERREGRVVAGAPFECGDHVVDAAVGPGLLEHLQAGADLAAPVVRIHVHHAQRHGSGALVVGETGVEGFAGLGFGDHLAKAEGPLQPGDAVRLAPQELHAHRGLVELQVCRRQRGRG